MNDRIISIFRRSSRALCRSSDSLQDMASQPIGTLRQRRRQNLDCDLAHQLGVARPVDFTPAVPADGRKNFVQAEFCADRQQYTPDIVEFGRSESRLCPNDGASIHYSFKFAFGAKLSFLDSTVLEGLPCEVRSATPKLKVPVVFLALKRRSCRPRPESARHCPSSSDLRGLHQKSFSHPPRNSWSRLPSYRYLVRPLSYLVQS